MVLHTKVAPVLALAAALLSSCALAVREDVAVSRGGDWRDPKGKGEKKGKGKQAKKKAKAPKVAVAAPKAVTIAIFADYDGCWDIISQTNPKANDNFFKSFGGNYAAAKGVLESAIERLTVDKKVILFVGSNRQSAKDDKTNQKGNGNGLALGHDGAFEKWEKAYWRKGWVLNKALLSDGDTPFSSWDTIKKSPWGKDESDKDLKVRIAENNFKYLKGPDPIDVFFFDDKEELLEHVRLHADIPGHIKFYTVHYDWYSYAKLGNTKPLVAKAKDGTKWYLCDTWPECDAVSEGVSQEI